jgi:hypothetical protein
MNTFSVYNRETGLFTGTYITCADHFLDVNVPEGCSCVLGSYDHLSQRVDLDSGVVVDYQPPQPSGSYTWDTETKRWVYVPTLADCKAKKLTEINDRCAELLAGVRAGYPPDEVQSWSKQETEARAYAADSSAPVPFLAALASARGIGIADLVSRVIVKADLFAATSGQIIGTRQHYEDLINGAETINQVKAVQWAE